MNMTTKIPEYPSNTSGTSKTLGASQHIADYATILSEAIAALSARIDEIRLPLHVLAENHFGELNDNQEEMIRAARAAAGSPPTTT